MATFEDFLELDIRVGRIVHAEPNAKASVPAYKLRIDFGAELGVKNSSAQLTENYDLESLKGRQVAAVVNFPPKKVAGFSSEVLVLAVVCEDSGTVLLRPDSEVTLGERVS
ncbi:tRNA-binding protein [Lipingzhangella halophila]|uniref:tRNA-binding protein n=1 Tax=Lipingzhangella halophila TaxID=1783352 RepID=A0A7W7W617_9ACTN|nr:tRNA-binding protein [Lipingzhangella halophila]MBB4935323.1 tRNA-binding protein [Lipingzhangella halophila]